MKPALKQALIKFAVVGVYALIGAAVQAELIPEVVGLFLKEHAVEAALTAMGLGHILPELGKKS